MEVLQTNEQTNPLFMYTYDSKSIARVPTGLVLLGHRMIAQHSYAFLSLGRVSSVAAHFTKTETIHCQLRECHSICARHLRSTLLLLTTCMRSQQLRGVSIVEGLQTDKQSLT